MRSKLLSLAVIAIISCGRCHAQAIGPDLVNSSLVNIARHGTDAGGGITGYSCGHVTCSRGDMPLDTTPNTSTRPIVGMNMFRMKPAGSGSETYLRLEQLGQGWAKWVNAPVNGTHTSCGGPCSGGGAGMMPPGCADVYSSGFNTMSAMGPRSRINPTIGVLTGPRGGGTGEANIVTRVQVRTEDVTNQPAVARFFFETVDLLPADAQYVRPGQTVAINAMNNATTQEISINGGTGVPTILGSPVHVPAISRWAEIDPGVTVVTADHDDTPNPSTQFPGTTIRSRFYIAGKAIGLAGGRWRYEYAVYNMNSDRACGSFAVPLPAGVPFSDFFFRHPPSHSGEPFSNVAWTATKVDSSLVFSTDPHSLNQNANAIRWGTMYNFGFTTTVAPRTGSVTLSLFKPGALTSIIAAGLPTVGAPGCVADMNGDGGVEIADLSIYLDLFEAGSIGADFDDGSGAGNGDGGVTVDDLLYFFARFAAGC